MGTGPIQGDDNNFVNGNQYWKQQAKNEEQAGPPPWQGPNGDGNVPVGQNIEQPMSTSAPSDKLSTKEKLVAFGNGFLHTLNPMNWLEVSKDIDRGIQNGFNGIVKYFTSE